MKLTKEIITSKLRNFCIPQTQCAEKAYEIASILFDQDIREFTPKRYYTLGDVLCEISNALRNEKIVIAWLHTGLVDPNNPTWGALHCYFVFEDQPLQSFTIWDSPGPAFYGEADTRNKIIETIGWYPVDGIGLHVVPPSLD